MKGKIEAIQKINDDCDYLRGEYDLIKLWGSCPDGDVKFDSLIEWLAENADVVEHMISTSKKIKEL